MLSALVLLPLILFTRGVLPKGRVFGGGPAAEGEFPYMASLQFEGYGHVCGASVIDSQWVLTSAQCIVKKFTRKFFVQFGSLSNAPQMDKAIYVKAIVVHPDYKKDIASGNPNDLALLQMVSKIPLGPRIQPVMIPYPNETFITHGASAVFSGFDSGTGSTELPIRGNLKRLYLITINDDACERLHPFKPASLTNRTYHLCAMVDTEDRGQGVVGPCRGDVGGPLVLNGKQIGIFSFTQMPCGFKDYPNVFTRVTNYANWIHNVISFVNGGGNINEVSGWDDTNSQKDKCHGIWGWLYCFIFAWLG